ncbi:uncharacterized protein I303_108233 [Kwoniella dejecticola CBS 10117]|uniref:Uncharacterized protein n=1 Tax=Kwoniella dejecticola CBS 10117 TaxID=1296121 RepID=A0A1A5ZXY8_9TREE|nr:uncharacterized protein I303_07441 [Kwoniella dejecticola CBS 10117]OBR82677.1 hypothetical protein I303_07441 [Kwoniella dejecticola CBS 10117]
MAYQDENTIDPFIWGFLDQGYSPYVTQQGHLVPNPFIPVAMPAPTAPAGCIGTGSIPGQMETLVVPFSRIIEDSPTSFSSSATPPSLSLTPSSAPSSSLSPLSPLPAVPTTNVSPAASSPLTPLPSPLCRDAGDISPPLASSTSAPSQVVAVDVTFPPAPQGTETYSDEEASFEPSYQQDALGAHDVDVGQSQYDHSSMLEAQAWIYKMLLSHGDLFALDPAELPAQAANPSPPTAPEGLRSTRTSPGSASLPSIPLPARPATAPTKTRRRRKGDDPGPLLTVYGGSLDLGVGETGWSRSRGVSLPHKAMGAVCDVQATTSLVHSHPKATIVTDEAIIRKT